MPTMLGPECLDYLAEREAKRKEEQMAERRKKWWYRMWLRLTGHQ